MKNPFKRSREHITPPTSILLPYLTRIHDSTETHIEEIDGLLRAVGLYGRVVSHTIGATVCQYHIDMNDLRDVVKIKRLVPALSAGLRRFVTIDQSNTAHVCLSVPRVNRASVPWAAMLRDMTMDERRALRISLGTDAHNALVSLNIADLPHLLIAGATGSGKSVALHAIINSILMTCLPSMANFVMIDPKQVELSGYAGIPHLSAPIAYGAKASLETLQGVCRLMDERYSRMRRLRVKNVSDTSMSRIVVIIDELADLMLTSRKQSESAIIRIAQLGRAAGIHLIVATQRPTVNVVTGLIKANIPARLALQTASVRDSMVILDHKGAETLIGRGDALLKLPDRVAPIRMQTAYIQDEDIKSIVRHWTGK